MQQPASEEVAIQRDYYTKHADTYDRGHLGPDEEHDIALHALRGLIVHYGIRSVLDVGAGTGRAISFLKSECPGLKVLGVEPVAALREVGYSKGLGQEELVQGDGCELPFADHSFDLVTEFGVLHHVRDPHRMVGEMLRVARRAIFISDANNFGQGSVPARMFKQMINAVGLWKFFNFIKTKGKGYSISEGDGVAYSYSVFNNYAQIRSRCERIHLMNTKGGGVNLYRSAGQVALWGLLKEPRG